MLDYLMARKWIPLLIVMLLCAWQASAYRGPLRVGIASMITPVDTVRYYQDIVDYLSGKLEMPIEMVNRKTYAEMDELLERGKIDVAFLCSAPYVRNKRAFGVNLLVAPEVNGRPFYRSLIIVHRDSPVQSFADLRGGTFAFTDPRSNTGKLYPEYLIAGLGSTADSFFAKYVFSYSHNKSIELVAKRQVDGAAIESLVFHYMLNSGSPYAKEVRVIQESMDFGIPPVVVSPGIPKFIEAKLREEFLNMHRDARGREILAQMHIDRFVEVPDSNYDSIRDLEAAVSSALSPSTASGPAAPLPIRFSIIPRDNPRIAYEKYQPLVDYLAEVTGYNIELALQQTYEETVEALGSGEVDFALLGPLTYLEARKKYGAIALLRAASDRGDGAVYRSVVVTLKESPITTLSDLRGRKFAFAATRSTSGNLLPRYMLAEEGIHLKDLGMFRHYSYHDTVIKYVLSGEFDAGAVRESVAERYMPAGLKIIRSSQPLPAGPLVVGPHARFTHVQSVRDALLGMSKTTRGRAVLQRMDVEFRGGFIPADDSDYEQIRIMFNNVPTTCGLGCHPAIQF